MSNTEIKHLFIASCYNSRGEYLSERRRDYCAAQFRWSCFIDDLCKSGEITQRAYDNATF